MKTLVLTSLALLSSIAFARPVPEKFLRGEVSFPVFMLSTDDRESGDSLLYHRFLNEEGFSDQGHIGSVRDYFIQNSNGQFKPNFKITKVKVKGTLDSYYGTEESLMHAILQQLPVEGNYAQFDADKDSYIDAFIVIFPGSEYGTKFVSHQNSLGTLNKHYIAGYDFDRYVMVAEKDQYDEEEKVLNGMGIFIHEFCHALGLQDHYDVKTLSGGTESWDVMATGMNNGDFDNSFTGRVPPKLNAFERASLGWLEFKELTADVDSVHLLPIDSNVAYTVTNPENEDEYFVLEYRTQASWDKELYEPGLLIWHVDYDADVWAKNELNVAGKPERFELVKASSIGYQSAIPFPGSQNVAQYEFKFKNGESAGFGIYNIQENGSEAYFSTNEGDEGKLPEIEKPQPEKDENGIMPVDLAKKIKISADGGVIHVVAPYAGVKIFKLFDMLGNAVYSKTFSDNTLALDANLPSGVYIVRMGSMKYGFVTRNVMVK